MQNLQPYLSCKSCFHPIVLPPATHPDMSQGLGSWPRDGHSRNFACLRCMNIHDYSAGDVLPQQQRTAASRKGNRLQNVVCIELPCDVGSCVSLLKIRILADADTEPSAEAPVVVAKWQVHSIRCDRGHIQNDVRKGFGVVMSADWDSDWEVRIP